MFDVTPAVLKNIEALELDYIVAIGGDDTLSYAAELDRRGMKVIAVPKTMDNDVRNTEYCIGFSTAITRAMDAIERQRTTVGSHERIGILGCSAATQATPLSIPHMSRPCAAASPSTR